MLGNSELLAAFDDDMEVRTALTIIAERVGEGRSQPVPHPAKQFAISDLHVVGGAAPESLTVSSRYIVLRLEEIEKGSRPINSEVERVSRER